VSSFKLILVKFNHVSLISLRSLKEKNEYLKSEKIEREKFLEFAKKILLDFGIKELKLGDHIN